MQFTNIIASLVLAATMIQAAPGAPDLARLGLEVAVNGAVTKIGAPVSPKIANPLEARKAKSCIFQACECTYLEGGRCAMTTDGEGDCQCPDYNPNGGSARKSVDCIGLNLWADRHKCP